MRYDMTHSQDSKRLFTSSHQIQYFSGRKLMSSTWILRFLDERKPFRNQVASRVRRPGWTRRLPKTRDSSRPACDASLNGEYNALGSFTFQASGSFRNLSTSEARSRKDVVPGVWYEDMAAQGTHCDLYQRQSLLRVSSKQSYPLHSDLS